MDCYCILPLARRIKRKRCPYVCLLDLCLDLRILQLFRNQYGASVQESRPLEGISIRRTRIHSTQPRSKITTCMASLCRYASPLSFIFKSCRPVHAQLNGMKYLTVRN